MEDLGVVHDYNLNTRKLRLNSYKFKASLGYERDPVSNKQIQKHIDGILIFLSK